MWGRREHITLGDLIPGFYDVNIRSPLTKIITEKTFCMDFQKNNKMKKHKKKKKGLK